MFQYDLAFNYNFEQKNLHCTSVVYRNNRCIECILHIRTFTFGYLRHLMLMCFRRKVTYIQFYIHNLIRGIFDEQ